MIASKKTDQNLRVTACWDWGIMDALCHALLWRRAPPASRPPDPATAQCWLLDLPDELLLHLLELALASDVLGVMRLCETCKDPRLDAVRQVAATRRLRWDPELVASMDMSGDSLTLLPKIGSLTSFLLGGWFLAPFVTDSDPAWAAGGLLPTNRRCSFALRIEHTAFYTRFGRMAIGVCDAEGRFGWGLNPYSGALVRLRREGRSNRWTIPFSPPPEGYPDGNGTQILNNWLGLGTTVTRLGRGMNNVLFEVILDDGALSFRINGGRSMQVISGFPRGAPLRPWVRVFGDLHETRARVTIIRGICAEER